MKKFIFRTSLFLLPIICEILFYVLVVRPKISGDLGRLDFIMFDSNYYAGIAKEMPHYGHTPIYNPAEANDSCGILVIGDSFSHFQNYHGTCNFVNQLSALRPETKIYNLDVTIPINNPGQLLIDMIRFQEQMPKRVVLEITERSLPAFLPFLVFDNDSALSEATKHANAKPQQINNESVLDIIIKNIDYAHRYAKKQCGIDVAVMRSKLSQPLFTCKGDESTLYFYKDDIETIINDADIMKDNIRKLHQLASACGIELLIVAPSDKYSLYKPWIIDNKYEDAVSSLIFFEDFKEEYFINTQKILRPLIENGEKDIYLCNDSHWGEKAACLIAEEIDRRMSK